VRENEEATMVSERTNWVGDRQLMTSRLYASFAEFAAKAQRSLQIVAPYVRTEALDAILRPIDLAEVTLITTWTVRDLLQGSSDLNLYPYLRSRGWDLYIHPSLHAKLLVADADRAIITSANMTKKGLGISEPCNNECASRIDQFAFSDRLWLSVLLKNSILVNDEYFLAFKRHLDKQALAGIENEEFDSAAFKVKQEFLLSSLPMSESPDGFLRNIDVVQTGSEALAEQEIISTLHDMALFSLDGTINQNDRKDWLRSQFFGHPFVRAFVESLDARVFFGEAKRWLQSRCSDEPTPSRKDLTHHVSRLFRWLAALGNGQYSLERPSHSECISLFRENQAF
jgi:phospholipase D-like protein